MITFTESTSRTFDITRGVQHSRLPNGLTVLTKEIHQKPVVSSIIWYRVGSRNEEAGLTGQSHFLEHMLFKGTDRLAKGEIDLITLKHGGSNNAFTDTDFTAYYFNFASDRWEVALEIEANRMINNTFAPEEFESEKQVVEEELRIGLDGPWELLDQEVWAAAYRQHPYHNPVIGWLQDLERATRDEMEAYYRQWYHPRNAVLVIAGDIETEKTLQRVHDLFGEIPPGPEPKPMLLTEQPQRGERRVIVKKQTEVERLQIGYHAPQIAHPDAYALQVLDAILGTGRTSRLHQRLEERDQSVTHYSVDYYDRIDPTLFLVRAEVRPDRQTADVERAIYEEIDRCQQSPVSDEELARARQLIRARFILGNEQASSQAITLGYYETIHSYEYLSGFFGKLDAVTADAVQRAAQRYLTADNRTVGWLVNGD
ncbi:MAG TPA: pitrilysin family protein [Blastocatellia bacterium]|nr:pitrilysin family protein [Blastocatellia bacterium]